MLINTPCVVSLLWTLADAQGQTLDELTDPVEFFYGGDDLLPKVEEALIDQEAGYECELHLEPEHAFGDYDSNLVCFESRSLFPDGVEAGMQIEGLPEGAVTEDMPDGLIFTVTGGRAPVTSRFDVAPGIPAPLPKGEEVLWQGRPDTGALAREAFKIRWIAGASRISSGRRISRSISTPSSMLASSASGTEHTSASAVP